MRITALLGAGSTMDIGGITSKQMTEEVVAGEQINFGEERQCNKLIGQIEAILNNYYGPKYKCNFEDILNALEIIYSLQLTEEQRVNKTPLGALVNYIPDFENLDYGSVMRACDDLINTVATRIAEYSTDFNKNTNNKFFKNFWQKATNEVPWDIITLNYDTCLENSLTDYEDGFNNTIETMGIKGTYAKRFSPSKLADTLKSRIMHIHGCIEYGQAIPSKDPNEFSFLESFYDMYKYNSYEDAKEHWNNGSNPQTQSGEQIFIGPIITGLRKTDKVIIYPYNFYLYQFQKALLENQSLFIAGYSCNDIYLNYCLIRMAELHGTKRRIVIVTYFSDEAKKNWHPDPYLRDTPTGNEYDVISRLLQEEYVGVLAKTKLPLSGKLESKDKCVKIYFDGLKKAIEKYGDEIIDFLQDR